MLLARTLRTHWKLISILVAAFLFRILYLVDHTIPFSFDHGKDSLAIMDMLLNLSPKFIGPWTSIPGLYFGPGWYYLLAPFYWLFGFDPLGGAVAMLLLVMLQIYLAYRYFGKFAALIIAGAPLWITLSKNAWNPYPMTLTTLLLLILLGKSIAQKQLTWRLALGLGLAASFGFHFSAAYAIFYPIIVFLAILIFRLRLNIKNILAAGLGFSLPFLPQLLFELRYSFSQARAILRYFQEGEEHAFGAEKILGVLQTIFGELKIGVYPEVNYLGRFAPILLVLLTAAITYFFLQKRKTPEIRQNFILAGLFILIPTLGFFFLHFNVWYVYAMVPAAVVFVASVLERSPRWLQVSFSILLALGVILSALNYLRFEKVELESSRGFLPIKLQAIEKIQAIAGDRPYASYHYVPDIYDFSYQYIYYWRAYQGHPLPTEFSYKPGESSYLVQKTDLQQRIPASTKPPEVVFFIVETPEHTQFLEEWWGQQQYGELQETIELSPSVTLYVATPAAQD